MTERRGVSIVLPEFASTQRQAIDELLVLQEAVLPEPAALKTTDLIVGVKSAAVSFVDFIMMTGQYQHMASPPYVPGLEFSGEVLWVGSDVKALTLGDRVMSDFMTVGPRSKGDYQQSGAWSSFAVAPESGLRRVPDDFDYDEAASFQANCETAFFAMVKRANVQRGERVLITGASGASGVAMVQIGKVLGAEVIVTGRSQRKLDAVLEAGADHAIVLSEPESGDLVAALREETRRITDKKGVDVVIDTVGGEVGYAAMRTLKFEGRMVIVGWASNVSASGGRDTFEPDRLPTNIMQMKCLQVLGSPMVIYSMANPDWRTHQISQVLAWASEGLLRPHVSHAYPVAEYRTAARAKFSGDVVGSCVLNF
ncbi:MAG: NADPH:quinone oxidoreductase family protein [Pseudomonadota bacterium]